MSESDKMMEKLYVWGRNAFFNRLLARELSRIADTAVQTINRVNLPLREYIDYADTHLIFCDCWQDDVHVLCNELLRLCRDVEGEIRFALLNVQDAEDLSTDLSRLNVDGVFYEHDSLDIFEKGVQSLLKGELWLSRQLMTRTLRNARKGIVSGTEECDILTNREKEILKHIAAGRSNHDIAEVLCISTNTVKTHVSNIYAKIDVPNRVHAILWASRYL